MTWDLHAIERSFANAASDPSLWGEAMDTVAAQTGSVGTLLFCAAGGPPSMPPNEAIQEKLRHLFSRAVVGSGRTVPLLVQNDGAGRGRRFRFHWPR